MNKALGYCRLRFGKMEKHYRHKTLISGLKQKARRVVTDIIAHSDGTGTIANILMEWI
jgi:hypothetical protein